MRRRRSMTSADISAYFGMPLSNNAEIRQIQIDIRASIERLARMELEMRLREHWRRPDAPEPKRKP